MRQRVLTLSPSTCLYGKAAAGRAAATAAQDEKTGVMFGEEAAEVAPSVGLTAVSADWAETGSPAQQNPAALRSSLITVF